MGSPRLRSLGQSGRNIFDAQATLERKQRMAGGRGDAFGSANVAMETHGIVCSHPNRLALITLDWHKR